MHTAAAALISLTATSPALLRRRLRAAGLLSSATNPPESSLSFSTGEPRSTFDCGVDDASPTMRASSASAVRDPGTHPFAVWVADDVGIADASPATQTRTFTNSSLKGSTLAATLE